MNAQQLFKAKSDGFEPVNSWFCERCGNVYNNEESAARCCCCGECGKPLENPRRYGDIHSACLKIRDEQAELRAIERAEKLTSWDGPVFWLDKFFPDMEALQNEIRYLLRHNDMPVPQWVFVGEEHPFSAPTMDDLISHITDEGYEGIEDDLDGVAEMEKALSVFADDNKGRVSYFEDTTRMAPVPTLVPIQEGDCK